MASRKRPSDSNQLAKFVVDVATGDVSDESENDGKDPAAVERGRKGGLKGGKTRTKRLTAAERSEIARKAALARWNR